MALGSSFRSALVAVDLGGTIEDSWSYKRIWYKARGFDLGPLPRGRREVIRDTDGRTDLYDQMVAEVYFIPCPLSSAATFVATAEMPLL